MTQDKLTKVSITLSVIAVVVSTYVVVSSAKFHAEESFSEKVETSIEAFVKKQQDAAKAAQAPAQPAGPVDVSVDDDAMKGDAGAPVTIIEFSEYQCPYCKRYVDQTLSLIQEKYIDTGKVKYVFRDFPLGFHQNAKPAAMAAECVRAKGGDDAYWKYHDKLFENQQNISPDNLKSYASDMGYDIATCLDTEEFGDEVDADAKEGASYGVQGTPAFFINGNFLSGAQPYANFEKLIEAELAK